MTAVEVLKTVRAMKREDREKVIDELLQEFPVRTGFGTFPKIVLSKPKEPAVLSDEERTELRRRAANLHESVTAEEFIASLSELVFIEADLNSAI